MTEVPAAVDSLNSGDVFLLDAGARLLLWTGASASVAEKTKAREVLMGMKEARPGSPQVPRPSTPQTQQNQRRVRPCKRRPRKVWLRGTAGLLHSAGRDIWLWLSSVQLRLMADANGFPGCGGKCSGSRSTVCFHAAAELPAYREGDCRAMQTLHSPIAVLGV